MLNYFIQKAHGREMLVHPRIVIGVPSENYPEWKTPRRYGFGVPREGQRESSSGGAGHGRGHRHAGLPITEPSGNMVVDIGGGTTGASR